MLEIEDLKAGQFYLTAKGELCYLLKIVFEDTIRNYAEELKETHRIKLYDDIVYRKIVEIGQGRYDYPYNAKYMRLHKDNRFIEMVDKEVLFDNKSKDHFILFNDKPYNLKLICAPAYSADDINSQAAPYKFPHALLLGKDEPRANSNIPQSGEFLSILQDALETIGFENVIYFPYIGPSMVGGGTIMYGFNLYFKNEEDYNLARLLLPVKFT